MKTYVFVYGTLKRGFSRSQVMREQRFAGEAPFGQDAPPPPDTGGNMSRREALAVLGLEDNASEEDIVAAHRSLIQKLHPDRGGNDYLAAKINQAKDRLLGDHR